MKKGKSGKNQVGKRKEQSADRQVVPRCNDRLPKVTDPEVAECQCSIGLTWVQLERMNPRPNSTHSARESEWTKV
ncbi:hypothetical protein MTR67_006915 [Solanum verrucosum]|uniref:Uncharacterized protein n=1 Tax=Solanum verrucosum TaxID=315347 RepID=A0AAF0Q2B7_SOLVR|nr:hypothetical protein MTR67_006915 [Solanum verrucosum]